MEQKRTCYAHRGLISRGRSSKHGSEMIINQTRLRLFVVFWIVIIASQYYFLYKKFDALSVCRDQHTKLDAMQAQMDRLRPLINGLKR
jgi:hypothetical protein